MFSWSLCELSIKRFSLILRILFFIGVVPIKKLILHQKFITFSCKVQNIIKMHSPSLGFTFESCWQLFFDQGCKFIGVALDEGDKISGLRMRGLWGTVGVEGFVAGQNRFNFLQTRGSKESQIASLEVMPHRSFQSFYKFNHHGVLFISDEIRVQEISSSPHYRVSLICILLHADSGAFDWVSLIVLVFEDVLANLSLLDWIPKGKSSALACFF